MRFYSNRRPPSLPHRTRVLSLVLLGVIMVSCSLTGWAEDPFERPPISYTETESHDPIAELRRQLEQGDQTLAYDPRLGYLPALLKALDIEADSQMLVFSKTSFQQRRIAPDRPRALYFNDTVYVGYVKGGDVLEISAVDPQLGAVFYSLEQREQPHPAFVRHTHECLQCHASSLTDSVPGHLVRSVYPDSDGFPLYRGGTFRTDHSSPLAERWGGWYVTGTHGAQRHMGNVTVVDKDEPEQLDREAGANVQELGKRFSHASYLTSHSDIVALMALEHQTRMHNLITSANYTARRALFDQRVINRMLEQPEDQHSPSTLRRVAKAGDRLLKYMLFCDEAPLTDPIAGTSSFAQRFSSQGPQDAQGRSLRQLDLKKRLFKYPCSYLIESEAFAALPPIMKDYVIDRLGKVLTGEDASEDFAHLTDEDRQAIREILTATRPKLVAGWTVAEKELKARVP